MEASGDPLPVDDPLQRIVNKRGGTIKEFRDRNNPDERVVRNRLLAVVLLKERYANHPDVNDIVLRKLECSPRFIQIADRLAEKDSEFRAQLNEIKGVRDAAQVESSAPVSQPSVSKPEATAPSAEKTPSPQVTHILEVTAFAAEITVDVMKGESETHDVVRARDVVFLLLTKNLGLSQCDAGGTLDRKAKDVGRAMRRMRSSNVDRRELLRRVCEELKISRTDLLSKIGRGRS